MTELFAIEWVSLSLTHIKKVKKKTNKKTDTPKTKKNMEGLLFGSIRKSEE